MTYKGPSAKAAYRRKDNMGPPHEARVAFGPEWQRQCGEIRGAVEKHNPFPPLALCRHTFDSYGVHLKESLTYSRNMPYRDPAKQREYQRQWVAGRRRRWLANKQCVMCGSLENLEIDHIDPSEKTSHRIWSWAPARLLAELEKCQVLCSLCHSEKTYAQNYTVPPHGTQARYKYRPEPCRCSECRRAHADDIARWRDAKAIA